MRYITLLFFTALTAVTCAHWKRVPQHSSNATSTAGNFTSLSSNFDSSHKINDVEFTRCASNPTTAQRRLLDNFSEPQCETTSKLDRTVDVYVHVVSTQAKRSRYSNAMIQNQMIAMSDAFASTGFSFELVGFDITVQDTWAQASAGSNEETAMKTSLHQGSYQDLNLYFLSDLGEGLLGFCYFPTSRPSNQMKILDGCIMLADSMPGGAATNYDMGLTAVHEVGHWFGLYHVFEGADCSDAKGDRVGDTPRQSTASFGCPVGKDSCPGIKGLDSINNYMDYSYDSCLFDFTSGQRRRMRALFDSIRAGN